MNNPSLSKLPYSGLLLDLDNTLLDFAYAQSCSLLAVYRQFFSTIIDKDSFEKRFDLVNKKLWQEMEEGKILLEEISHLRFSSQRLGFGASLPTALVADCYEENLIQHNRWLPGAKSAVSKLKKDFALGIITNGLLRVQKGKLALFNINAWADSLVISEEVGFSKPDKRIFDHALADLNLSAHQVLMVGDTLSSDYQGAINAGIDFCWINPEKVPLPSKYPAPKYIVESIAELCE